MTYVRAHYCTTYKHYIPRNDGPMICQAYPLSIPKPIQYLELYHDISLPRDDGIQYEPAVPVPEGKETSLGVARSIHQAGVNMLRALIEDEREGEPERKDNYKLGRDRGR